MIIGLKLKCDASGGKTIHDGALILVGCMESLSVLGCSGRFCRAWISPCFKKLLASMSTMSKGDEGDFLVILPLSIRNEHRIQS